MDYYIYNMKKLVLIAGLPRSGSTLLCNILNMNPRFHATATSPMIDMISSVRTVFSHNITSKTHNRLEEMDRVGNALNSFIHGYYADSEVVFDKSRGWPSKLSVIDEIFKTHDVKIIWTYRDPVQIVNSIESKHRKTILLENADEVAGANLTTLNQRVDAYINDGGIVASPVWFLNDLFDMGMQDRVKIVRYGDLTSGPQLVMNQIHDFIGEDMFEYGKNNFKDLKQTTNEFDGLYNYKFSHNINEGEIKYVEHPIMLPEYLIEKINQRFSWVNGLVN